MAKQKVKAPKKPRKKGKQADRPVTERESLQQEFIPGCEPQEPIQELDDAARIYLDAMQDRKALTEDEDAAKDSLLLKMKEHGLHRYEGGNGYVVTITDSSKLKVKKKKDAEPEANGHA